MTTQDLSKANMQQLKRAKVVEDIPQRLDAWFKTRITNAGNVRLVSCNRSSGEAGMSAEIFIVTVCWDDLTTNKSRQEKYVVRAEINAPNNASANTNYMISALKILGKTGLPIPEVLWAEHDKSVLGGPFCVMEFLEGIVAADSPPFTIGGWVHDATEQQRRKMYLSGITFLTKLHQLDWEQLGLDYLLKRQAGVSHTEWFINQAIEIYDQAVEGKRGEYEKTTIKWLKENLPEDENLKISWSDSRPGNMLWKDFELVGALDWEMVTLLDPAYDVSLWLYSDYNFAEGSGIKRLPGMLERDEFVETYESIAGVKLKNFDFYEVFSAFRSHAVVGNMIAIWEKSGQHLFGEGITIENCPTAKSYREIVARHI